MPGGEGGQAGCRREIGQYPLFLHQTGGAAHLHGAAGEPHDVTDPRGHKATSLAAELSVCRINP